MIWDTRIESKVTKRMPVMGCDRCGKIFSVVLYPQDKDGQPVAKPVGSVIVCPFCGGKDHASSESANLSTGN